LSVRRSLRDQERLEWGEAQRHGVARPSASNDDESVDDGHPVGDLGPELAAGEFVAEGGDRHDLMRLAVGELGQAAVDHAAVGLGDVRVEQRGGVAMVALIGTGQRGSV
jgi:hypothetical protein